MPKGYWLVRVTVQNEKNYPDYLQAAKVAFDKFGAKFLVRGGNYERKEGFARDRNVVVEFDSFETATACYHSPEYQVAQSIRAANAETDFLIVEGAR